MKKARNMYLAKVIDEEEEFTFSYVYTPRRTSPLGLVDLHRQEILLSHCDALTPLAMAMTTVVEARAREVEEGGERDTLEPLHKKMRQRRLPLERGSS